MEFIVQPRWRLGRALLEPLAQRVVALRDPQRWARELRPCFTQAGGALAFDLGVFALLAVLAWSLLTPWQLPLGRGASLMLMGVIAFALLWASISAPDWQRYRKLRRRWLACTPGAAAVVRRSAPRVRPAPPPPPVRSAYRPVREAQRSRSLWRASGH